MQHEGLRPAPPPSCLGGSYVWSVRASSSFMEFRPKSTEIEASNPLFGSVGPAAPADAAAGDVKAMFLVPGRLGKRTPRLFRLSGDAILITKSVEATREIARIALAELVAVTLTHSEVDRRFRVELCTRWSTMRLEALGAGAREFVAAVARATGGGGCGGPRPLGVHETTVAYRRYASEDGAASGRAADAVDAAIGTARGEAAARRVLDAHAAGAPLGGRALHEGSVFKRPRGSTVAGALGSLVGDGWRPRFARLTADGLLKYFDEREMFAGGAPRGIVDAGGAAVEALPGVSRPHAFLLTLSSGEAVAFAARTAPEADAWRAALRLAAGAPGAPAPERARASPAEEGGDPRVRSVAYRQVVAASRRRAAAAARALGHVAASVHLDAESLHAAIADDGGPGAAATSSRCAALGRSVASLSGVALRQLEYSVQLARSAEARLVDALVEERWTGGGPMRKPDFSKSAPRFARETWRGKGRWQERFFSLDESTRALHYYRPARRFRKRPEAKRPPTPAIAMPGGGGGGGGFDDDESSGLSGSSDDDEASPPSRASAPPAPEGFELTGTIDLADALQVRGSRAPKAPPFSLDVETPTHVYTVAPGSRDDALVWYTVLTRVVRGAAKRRALRAAKAYSRAVGALKAPPPPRPPPGTAAP